MDVPTIHLGIPEGNLEDYYKYQEDGVIVYITKNVKLEKNELKIDLSKLLMWKKLTIEGVLVSK